jgi:hypothetical protein
MSQTKAQLIDNLVQPITGALGSASAPTFSFTADPNTGVYSPGSDQLALSTGGTGRLFVDANGVISIGASSNPNATARFGVTGAVASLLDLYRTGVAGEARLNFYNDNSASAATVAGRIAGLLTTTTAGSESGALLFVTNNSGTVGERARITAEGRLGLGTSSPRGLLDLGPGTGNGPLSSTPSEYQLILNADQSTTGDISRNIAFVNTTFDVSAAINSYDAGSGISNGLVFATANTGTLTEKLRITHTGLVGIGTTSPGSPLDVNGSIRAGNYHILDGSTAAAGVVGFSTSNGPSLEFWGSAAAGSGSLIAKTAGSERARIDSSGRLLVGTEFNFGGGKHQVGNGNINIGTYIGAAAGTYEFVFNKSRSSTIGSNTVVVANDLLGQITFKGADGTNQITAATINVAVDGTPGANSMPGRLVFSTTANGASSPTERMRISSSGAVSIPGSLDVTGTITGPTQPRSENSTTLATTQFAKNLFGASTTTGTLDWNHVSNTTPGVGETLLTGNATNGPGGGVYFHPLNFEFSSKTGAGNLTQFAVGYNTLEMYQRYRFSNTWSSWVRLLNSDNFNSYALPLTGGTLTGTLTIGGAGDITIAGGGLIKADFTNATIANRTYFQTTTTNNSTVVGAIPNGTSTNATFGAFNNSDPTNSSFVGLTIGASVGRINCSTTGTGTYLPLSFETNNQEQARFTTTDRYFRMAAGTGGIQFKGDTAAANALDDYEEGTFTPVIEGTTTTGTGTYTSQVGRYTKIGNRVQYNLLVLWTAHTGTGNLRVAGLPFTSQSTGNNLHPAALYSSNLTTPANHYPAATVANNTTTISVYSIATGGSTLALLAMDTAATLYISGHYETAT